MDEGNMDASPILCIPEDIEQLGTGLFLQQMWCWGQDIRHEEGNLLLDYGFTRERPPEGTEGSSLYLLRLDDKRSLIAWGFGIFYTDAEVGGMFLKRQSFMPKLAPTADLLTNCWRVGELPATSLPRTREEGLIACTLFAAALDCISNYEQWVESKLGCEYRQGCLEKWGQAFVSQNIAGEWKRLAELCQSFMPDNVLQESGSR